MNPSGKSVQKALPHHKLCQFWGDTWSKLSIATLLPFFHIITITTTTFTTTTNKPTAFTIAIYLPKVWILWRHKSLNWSEDEGGGGGGGVVEIMQKLFIHPRRHLTFIDCTWVDCRAQRTLSYRFGPRKVATEFLREIERNPFTM